MEDALVAVFIHGCVVGQNCEGVWLGRIPTHDWSQGSDCWHETGLGAPDELFSDAPKNQKEDSSEKMGAALESLIPANVSACL